jgi:hypothetical protein
MRRGERCWGAVCGRTACTVRQGAAGEAGVHGDTEYAPEGKPTGLSPCDLSTDDQPAAYLTGHYDDFCRPNGDLSREDPLDSATARRTFSLHLDPQVAIILSRSDASTAA